MELAARILCEAVFMRFDMHRRILAIAAAAVWASLSQMTFAADWPSKPVRIISPTSPGGVSDTLARMLAEGFADIFGQRFYVENRVGAGGLIGVAAAANAEPDGSTLVISGIAYTVIAPAASTNPGFHPMRDLAHIAYLGGPPIVFVVNPSIGVRSLVDLAEYARRTGTLNYGSPGVGTLGHFIAERFSREAKVPMQHIPNRGGSTAMMDLVAGTVGLVSTAWSSALGQIRGGQVIPIAVSSEVRLAEAPQVPTLKELGYPNLATSTWFGLSGPAKMPRDIVEKINQAVSEVLRRPAVRERIQRDAIEIRTMSPDEYTAYMASELQSWGPLAKQLAPQN
jgi:tripartite-type tricarboxylate transporter receptor subunit TctC